MAETEERTKQDIGQDEAYVVNLKEVVASEKDFAGRSRNFADAIMAQVVKLGENTTATLASIQASIALAVQKQVENVTCVNTTDFVEGSTNKSPYDEIAKAVATAVLAEMNKAKA